MYFLKHHIILETGSVSLFLVLFYLNNVYTSPVANKVDRMIECNTAERYRQ